MFKTRVVKTKRCFYKDLNHESFYLKKISNLPYP